MGWQIPEGLRFTRTHEWLREEAVSTVVAGITDYAQDKLGSIVFVELPGPGRQVQAGRGMAVIESVKAVADTYSPVDGTVVEFNEALLDQPELLNRDPYGEGWMVRIEVADGYDFSGLLNREEYLEHIRRQEEEGVL
jgi:glycine cleavage system H protein